jgi:hypothetical protein
MGTQGVPMIPIGCTREYLGGTPRKCVRASNPVPLSGWYGTSQEGRTTHCNGEFPANWLHRRGTRRVLTPAFCRAVHRCACVRAVPPTPSPPPTPPTPAPTLTPARSPTLAPTTVAPAVAPSGMSFLQYPRVPWGCPFYDLEYRIAYRLSSSPLSTLGYPLGC